MDATELRAGSTMTIHHRTRADDIEIIKIATDFSRYPAGRYRADGPNSGERFREDILRPALETAESVQVVLDDTSGYGSSFLEESFGGLVRKGYFSKELLRRKLKIIANSSLYDTYKRLSERYISEAQPDQQAIGM